MICEFKSAKLGKTICELPVTACPSVGDHVWIEESNDVQFHLENFTDVQLRVVAVHHVLCHKGNTADQQAIVFVDSLRDWA